MNVKNLILGIYLGIALIACNKSPKDQNKQTNAAAKEPKSEAPALRADTLQTPCAIFYFPTEAHTNRQIDEAKKKGNTDEAVSEAGSDEGFYRMQAIDILRAHNVPVVMLPEGGIRAFNLKQADGRIVALPLDEAGGVMLCNGKDTPKKLAALATPEDEYTQAFGINIQKLETANTAQYKTYKGGGIKFNYPSQWLSDAQKMEYCPACYTSLEGYVAFHTAQRKVGVSAYKESETINPDLGNVKKTAQTHLRNFGKNISILFANGNDNSYDFWYLLRDPEGKQIVYANRTIKLNDGWYTCAVAYPAAASAKYFMTAQAILETFGSK